MPLTTYTIIPDLHADAMRLDKSIQLAEMTHRMAFLGDFIDAGAAVAEPDDAAVLERVRRACDDGLAMAVMGNHELNAILFHRCDDNGRPLRLRDAKNLKQHRSFCDRFGIGTSAARDWTDWFLTLPLWLDLGGLRLVHACWNTAAIATIAARRPDGRLTEADLPEIAEKRTAFANAVSLLLSGPEVALPPGFTFTDAGGHVRSDVRIAWWRANAPTWRAASLSVPNPMELPDCDVDATKAVEFYGPENPPVLVGHYKMKDDPKIETMQAACLDYPLRPSVYQWSGEGSLRHDRLIEVTA
jgi:hypothetical protein